MSLIELNDVYGPRLKSNEANELETTLSGLREACTRYSAAELGADELAGEFRALGDLYRDVREADAVAQALHRSSDVREDLIAIYYSLRSAQASLSMAYSVAGPEAERPERSPLGTTIGLFDAPKILAQETHLESGSYDDDLDRFSWWMREIWRDYAVRHADYIRFYGEAEVLDAREAVRRILGLDEQGNPRRLELEADGNNDPARLRRQLVDWATDSNDLLGAVRVIQRVGGEGRLLLTALLANRETHEARFGSSVVSDAVLTLQEIVGWPYPVGDPLLFDLDQEQMDFDALLMRIPTGVDNSLLEQSLCDEVASALRRACAIEQSLRVRRNEYGARGWGSQRPRTFRWYVWELVTLLDRSCGRQVLGSAGRGG